MAFLAPREAWLDRLVKSMMQRRTKAKRRYSALSGSPPHIARVLGKTYSFAQLSNN
jgi:hypothetical protein